MDQCHSQSVGSSSLQVDCCALPGSCETKLFDSVLELRYRTANEDPPNKKRKVSEGVEEEAANVLRVGCSAHVLAMCSEKFRRALDPTWSGNAKEVVVEVEEGSVEHYQNLLHHLHTRLSDAPWLPEGVEALVGLMCAAHAELVDCGVLAAARALEAEMVQLRPIAEEGELFGPEVSDDHLDQHAQRLAQAVVVLAAAKCCEASSEDASSALQALAKAAQGAIVAMCSPLQQFFVSPELERKEVLTMLSLDAIEGLLKSEELVLDCEETALEAALFWLHYGLNNYGEEDERDAAHRLLRHMRWGVMAPASVVGAWQRSRYVRLFDPHRRIAVSVMLAKGRRERLAAWRKARLGDGLALWVPRPQMRTGQQQKFIFKVKHREGPAEGPARFFGEPAAYWRGLTYKVYVAGPMPSDAPFFVLGVLVAQPAAWLDVQSLDDLDSLMAGAAPLACGPPLNFRLGLKPHTPGQGGRSIEILPAPDEFLLQLRAGGQDEVSDEKKFAMKFEHLGTDNLGQPLTWAKLWGPHSPFAVDGALTITLDMLG